MNAAISRLVSPDIAKLKLVPVRGDDPVMHFARANAKGGIEQAPALCKLEGPLDRFSRPKWKRLRAPGEKTCMTCQAEACAIPSIVVWR